MTESWLRTNRRLFLAAAVAAFGAGLLVAMVAAAVTSLVSPVAARWVLIALVAAAWVLFVGSVWWGRRPRLAYANGQLLVNLRPGSYIRVPIELIECFLMGQGPSFLPGQRYAETATSTVVVRLRPQAEEWSHVDVDPRYGSWCDSHIIIRGTWCEPINVPLVQRLNDRLVEVQRACAGGARTP